MPGHSKEVSGLQGEELVIAGAIPCCRTGVCSKIKPYPGPSGEQMRILHPLNSHSPSSIQGWLLYAPEGAGQNPQKTWHQGPK